MLVFIPLIVGLVIVMLFACNRFVLVLSLNGFLMNLLGKKQGAMIELNY